MDLSELGFDSWFEQRREELRKQGLGVARVARVERDRYLLRSDRGEIAGVLSGNLQFSARSADDLPCVGDWVLVRYHDADTRAIVHAVLPRKTLLRRKSAGAAVDYQMMVANIDHVFIVQSCDRDFNLRRMERYLVMASDGHVEPIILLSKTDLVTPADVRKRLSEITGARIDARVIAFSTRTGDGLDAIQRVLERGKTYCLLGSSGVGKTTLLNHLLGGEVFETAPVRDRDGRGRHTTARRQLTILRNGALLIDTPGLRELGMLGVGASIDEMFSDIQQMSTLCRFNDCTHTTEVGCAILKAIQSGDLTEERYQSYLKLKKESAFHEMSYAQRRKKDRQFGRMVKAAMKHHRKT